MTVFVDFLESKTSRLTLIPIDRIVEIGRSKDGGVYINCEGLETLYCNWSIDEFHKQIKDRRDEAYRGPMQVDLITETQARHDTQ